ncbi:MAG: antibiotic biosynthesis monooxygenase [Thermodesulfobacteriota bacterium]
MAVIKSVITRRVKEGKAMSVFSLLNKLRTEALNQPGYISGETLVGHDDPAKFMVIATWLNLESWLKWKESPLRRETEAKIQEHLTEPTRIEVFTLGAFPHKK